MKWMSASVQKIVNPDIKLKDRFSAPGNKQLVDAGELSTTSNQ